MEFLHRTWAEIDIDALVHNFNLVRKNAKGAKIFSVVKADAYGHGLDSVVRVLLDEKTDAFAVSNIDEALEIRKIDREIPILILGYTPEAQAKILAENDIIQAVYSLNFAKRLSGNAKKQGVFVKFHLKLDTGMGRIGFDCRSDELPEIQQILETLKLSNLIFDGVFTHFASSDGDGDPDLSFTKSQLSRFKKATDIIKNAGYKINICHCCNSAAVFLDEDNRFDACRPGIVLYGLSPTNTDNGLIPVMTLKSVISFIKNIKKGETVSYGRTFKAQKDMKIATIPAGYGDGYPRHLSGKGCVLINGKKAPIVGRVCMDQFCVDVSEIDGVCEGDEVVLFGKELSVGELARISGTIHYEIICGISKRVPRIIKKG